MPTPPEHDPRGLAHRNGLPLDEFGARPRPEVERAPELPGIQSVQRALQLLSMFTPPGNNQAKRRARWSVSDLARETGLHKSVVARLMATMAMSGFVVQDPVSRQYQVGPMAFAAGSAYEPFSELDQAARPVLEGLTASCGHAAYLAVPLPNTYLVIVATESRLPVQVKIELGERRRYHSGAIGRVLLADKTDEEIRLLVGPEPYPRMTPYTISTWKDLTAAIAEVRRTGVAINHQESIIGANAVAVGVRNPAGELIAGMAVAPPANLVSDAEEADLVHQVIQAGREIERRLTLATP